MSKITEARNLPENERVYLKKDRTGWRVVEPYKNPETGKINLFAGWKKSIIPFLFVLLIMSLFLVGYREATKSVYGALNEIVSNPTEYCNTVSKLGACREEWKAKGICGQSDINFSLWRAEPP